MKRIFLVVGLALNLLACKEENEIVPPIIEGKYQGYLFDVTAQTSKTTEVTVTKLDENTIKVEGTDLVDSRQLSFTAVHVSTDNCCAKFNLTPTQSEGDGIQGFPVTSVCPENLTLTRWADTGKSQLSFRVGWGERVFSFNSSPDN